MTDHTATGITAIVAADFLDSLPGEPCTDVGPIGAGAWSQAFSFSRAGRDYVVRFGAHRDDFERDHLAASFASPALPVPRTVAIGEAFGGFYSITERVYGDFLDDADGPRMRRVLPSLLAMLDAMRSVDLSASTGFGNADAEGNGPYPSWSATLIDVGRDNPEHRTHGWYERLRMSPHGTAAFDSAYACLKALAPRCPNARHVIHSDLLNRNVLIQDDRINGVFDWGCLLYGDFLYDVAWLTFWAPWYPAWKGIDFEAEVMNHARAIGLELPDAQLRLRCYEIHIGVGSYAYNAYLGNWSNYGDVVNRTTPIVESMETFAGRERP